MSSRAASRTDDHDHAAAFHHRPLLDHREVVHGLDDGVEHELPHLGVHDLAAPEDDDELALVALRQEAPDVLHLEVEVVLVGLRAELDLLQDDRRLVLARSLFLLRRLVLELPEVHDLANRRHGARVDLDQLEARLVGEAQRLLRGDDADLGAIGADDPDLGYADATSDAVVVRRAGGCLIEWPWDDLSPGLWVASSWGRLREVHGADGGKS